MAQPTLIGEHETSAPGDYLTDGYKLFRVLDHHRFDSEALVETEDCQTLDVWLISPAEVAPLRPVLSSPAQIGG